MRASAISTRSTPALGAVEDNLATATPAAVPAADGSAQGMAALASLESALTAREVALLVLQPTRGTRKRIRSSRDWHLPRNVIP